MKFNLYLSGQLVARDLMIETCEDLVKVDCNDILWAVEQDGRCNVLDDSNRELELRVAS